MIAGMKKEHKPKIQKILEAASKSMSYVEDDGIGYAAITSSGRIYGEKWVKNSEAWNVRTKPVPTFGEIFIQSLLDKAAKNLKLTSTEVLYEKFGSNPSTELTDDTVAVILHARKQTTGGVSIQNTHPFYMIDREDEKPDIALIHNGTINNHLTLKKKFSTCDSEVILHQYDEHGLNYNPWSIQKLADNIAGLYTVGVLTSTYSGEDLVPILDIFKHNKDLHVGYCPAIETAIFTTNTTTFDSISRETGFEITNVTEITDGYFIRIDATTGSRLEDLIEFNGRTNTHQLPKSIEPSTEDNEPTIETVKLKFESAHSELFTKTFHTPSKLTDDEARFMESLKKASNTNLAALKLIQKVLGVTDVVA